MSKQNEPIVLKNPELRANLARAAGVPDYFELLKTPERLLHLVSVVKPPSIQHEHPLFGGDFCWDHLTCHHYGIGSDPWINPTVFEREIGYQASEIAFQHMSEFCEEVPDKPMSRWSHERWKALVKRVHAHHNGEDPSAYPDPPMPDDLRSDLDLEGDSILAQTLRKD